MSTLETQYKNFKKKNPESTLTYDEWHNLTAFKPRFVGKDGEFIPTAVPTPGTITIGYLEELCEWLFYHDALDHNEKMDKILAVEDIIRTSLSDWDDKMNYVPSWSVKLSAELEE